MPADAPVILKTDLEFVATALAHAMGGMRAVQEKAPQGTAAARYAAECEQALAIINRMQRDETSDEPRLSTMYVSRICSAYESGFGRGLSKRDVAQPYAAGTPEALAYFEGYTRAVAKIGAVEPSAARESDWHCVHCGRDNDPTETHCVQCEWSRKHTIAGVLHERGCFDHPCICGAVKASALPTQRVVNAAGTAAYDIPQYIEVNEDGSPLNGNS